MKKICLSMIVKNEQRNILSCLTSVEKFVDYVYILDTGSTDQTKHIIEEWANKTGIPTTVMEHPFTNFGEMRTMAFNLAKEKYQSDYMLTLDARHILNGNLDKDLLCADVYEIAQIRINIRYLNIRLLKTSIPWKCIGAVHEYWGSSINLNKGILHDVYITENGIEPDKRDKILWYKKLLEDSIAIEQDIPLKLRYIFYLANTLFDMSDFQAAIQKYLERLKSGGWVEELYYCNYRIGLAYEYLGQPEASIGYYLKCHKLIPTRAEHLYQLAKLSRDQNDMKLSFLYALQGSKISKPEGLFIESDVYDYLLDFELSVSGFYIQKDIGKQAQNRLLSKSLPDTYAQAVKNNNQWYL